MTFNIQRSSTEDDPGIRIAVVFAARQHPEDYRDQIVHASSHCTYPARLARWVQDEIVAWTEHTP
jgi:pyruvate-formate lyase